LRLKLRSFGLKWPKTHAQEGQICTPIGGQLRTPIDINVSDAYLLTGKNLVPPDAFKRSKPVPMLIVIKAEFDPDSESWWATADIDDRHALATGAPTLNELLERIPIVLRSLLAEAYPDTEIPFSIVAHKFSVVNTRVA